MDFFWRINAKFSPQMWSAYPRPDLLDFGTPCKKLANGSELSWGRGGGGGKGGKVCIEGKRSWCGGGGKDVFGKELYVFVDGCGGGEVKTLSTELSAKWASHCLPTKTRSHY